MANIAIYDASVEDEKFFRQRLSDQPLAFTTEPMSLSNVAPAADIISLFVSSRLTREILNKFPNVKLIATRSTGYDHVDSAAAKERNILISTVPTYGEHTVAEYTFGLLLSLTRKLPDAFDAADNGNRSHGQLQGMDLFGRTLGIIGCGRIGRNTAKIAKGFGMEVIGYDPFPNQQAATEIGFSYKSLDEILMTADVVSLHVPYTPENHHLMNVDRLARLKPTAILINTARGELIDTKALVEAVGGKRLAGVALDVIESEQLISPLEELALLRADKVDSDLLMHSVEINILREMPNVLVTSHNAFNTREAIERINQTTAENIRSFLIGQPSNLAK